METTKSISLFSFHRWQVLFVAKEKGLHLIQIGGDVFLLQIRRTYPKSSFIPKSARFLVRGKIHFISISIWSKNASWSFYDNFTILDGAKSFYCCFGSMETDHCINKQISMEARVKTIRGILPLSKFFLIWMVACIKSTRDEVFLAISIKLP